MTVGRDVIAFRTPLSGGTPLVVSGSSETELKSGVKVLNGTGIFEGMLKTDASVTGGTAVSLSSYTGGNGGFGPGGGGGFGPGGGGGFGPGGGGGFGPGRW